MSEINAQKIKLPDKWSEWELIDRLGEGAYGAVYKAKRELEGKQLYSAIKIIRIPHDEEEEKLLKDTCSTPEELNLYYKDIVKSYVSEIQNMELLKGISNIVSIEDYHVEESQDPLQWTIYIRMELLQNLSEYMQSLHENITEETIIQIGIDICSALEKCEKIGIIHRDIKRGNICVSSLGLFKLGDFGISKKIERFNDSYSLKGTYSYMAPEIYHGERYNHQVDIYSLGLVMYELLNRKRGPFVSLSKQLIYYKDREKALELRMKGEKIPAPVDASEELSKVILRACEYRPSDRYKNAHEFKIALEKVLNAKKSNLEKESEKDSEKESEKKSKSWKKRAAILSGAAVVLVASIIAGYFIMKKPVEKTEKIQEAVQQESSVAEAEGNASQTKEVMQAYSSLFAEALKCVKEEDEESFHKLFVNTDEGRINLYYETFLRISSKNLEDYQHYTIWNMNETYVCCTLASTTLGEYPAVTAEWETLAIPISLENNRWRFRASEGVLTAFNEEFTELCGEEFLKAYQDGYNIYWFGEQGDYTWLDKKIMIPSYLDVRPYLMWQNKDGSVKLLINVKNGTDQNQSIKNLNITVTDKNNGEVLAESIAFNVITPAKTSESYMIPIEAEKIKTGDTPWNMMEFTCEWGE